MAVAVFIALPLLLAAASLSNIDRLRSFVRQHPANTQAQFDLGLALVRAGQLREAIEPLQKAVSDPALADEARFLLGADYFESHDGESAIKSLIGLDHSAHSERVLYMLEESYRSMGNAQEARSAFRELNARYADGPWMHLLMASAYENQAQPEKAIEEYKLVIAKDPAMSNARFAVGYLYWRQGELQTASTWFKEEASVTTCHSLANFYLGEIARTDHLLAEAEASYRKAISCDPAYGDAHLRLGSILSAAAKSTEALAQLQLAATLMPEQSAPHYQMASLYRRLGQTARADAEYRTLRLLKAKADETDEKHRAR